MFTRQEIIDFRCKLLQENMRLNQWCSERGINYNVFLQEINGFRTKKKALEDSTIRTQKKHEAAIREFMDN